MVSKGCTARSPKAVAAPPASKGTRNEEYRLACGSSGDALATMVVCALLKIWRGFARAFPKKFRILVGSGLSLLSTNAIVDGT